jgi:hypothetical protein
MSVHLLEHLHEHGPGLAGARHVVQEDELRRVGHIDRAIRLVERVLACGDNRQCRAVGTELRPHGLTSNEVRVVGQARVQVLLNRAIEERRRDELAGRQPQRTIAPALVTSASASIVVVLLAPSSIVVVVFV